MQGSGMGVAPEGMRRIRQAPPRGGERNMIPVSVQDAGEENRTRY